MSDRNRFIGKRYDGGRSPLGSTPDIGPPPLWPTLDTAVGGEMKPTGVKTAENIGQILIHARDDEACLLPGWKAGFTVRYFKETLRALGMTSSEFLLLEAREQNRVLREVKKLYEKKARSFKDRGIPPGGIMPTPEDDARIARTELHVALRAWNAGPLRLEHPQGSSYHHLVNYERSVGIDGRVDNDPQCIVVENDWARVIAGKDIGGEVRMPFPDICWEFRISGVRVLAFTVVSDDGVTSMVLIYGRGGVWVSDDYYYVLPEIGKQLRGVPHPRAPRKQFVEFRAVADLVHAQIRAACILLDARATKCDQESSSRRLTERIAGTGRMPPRDYHVVRPLREHNRVRRVRSRGAGIGVAHSPQGGHLRPGRWLHYDDQDSGRVQYANDGGFVVSKSWQRWHWAGDLSRMIEREYRL